MNFKALIIFITMSFSMPTFSDCRDYYKSAIKMDATKAVKMTAGGISSAWISFLPFYIGSVIVAGEPVAGISMIGLGLSSLAAGGYGIGKGVSFTVQGVRLLKALQLINQSEVGVGSVLSDLADSLSLELNRDVTESEIAEIVIEGNQQQDFCSDSLRSPFTKNELVQYIKENL